MESIQTILQIQFNKLAMIISDKMAESDFGVLKYILKSYSNYLRIYGLEVRSEIMNELNKCVLCMRDSDQTIDLNCGHKVCPNVCFTQLIEIFTAGDFSRIDFLRCPDCGIQVDTSITIKFYGGIQAFNQVLDRTASGLFVCLICKKALPIADRHTLICKHDFCGTCLKNYLKVCIMQSQPDISCYKCKAEISKDIYTSILNPKVIENLKKISKGK